ncbi:MAG: AI-2E family transporter [Leptospira sp.]|nr:AI-2E family transporter [Leptospira sp.]
MSHRRQNISVYLLKYAFYFLVISAIVIAVLGVKALVIPILFSMITFYVFNRIVDNFESIGISRLVSIIFIFSVLGTSLFFLIYELIAPLYQESSPLFSDWLNQGDQGKFKFMKLSISFRINDLDSKWDEIIKPDQILTKSVEYIKGFIKSLAEFVPTLVTYLIITPIITFFLLLEGDRIYKEMITIVPNRFFEMTLMITHKINEQITSYLKSLVIQGLIMAAIVSTGFYFIGLDHFLVFGLFVGIANSIPYVGPILGAVPPLVFTIVDNNPNTGLLGVLGVIAVGQLVDNILVQPAIIAKSVSLHPLIMIGGVVVGGEIFGLLGMLFAVPVLSIMKVSIGILYKSLKDHQII